MAADADSGYAIRDAVTGRRLRIGRPARSEPRHRQQSIARHAALDDRDASSFKHEDPDERSAAIREVGESEDLAMLETLEQLLATEQHGGVRTAIAMAIATLNLDSTRPGDAPGGHRGRQQPTSVAPRAYEAHRDR